MIGSVVNYDAGVANVTLRKKKKAFRLPIATTCLKVVASATRVQAKTLPGEEG